MAYIAGRNERILLYIGGGPGEMKLFRGRRAVFQPRHEAMEATLIEGGTTPVWLQVGMTAEVDLDTDPASPALGATLEEQMALAVLAGDQAAALALADRLFERRMGEGKPNG